MAAIGISGGIGSGKTTLAEDLARALNCPLVSFGRYVKAVAAERGLGTDRETLQALGEALIAEQGWNGFVRSALASAGWASGDVVVEGIRHKEVVGALREALASVPFCHVFVEATTEARAERVEEREGITAASLARLEQHSTERQVSSLRDAADLLVRGDALPADNVQQVLKYVRSRGA